MIALLKRSSKQNRKVPHEPFLVLLPKIQRQARLAFRELAPEAREEMTQEVVANAYRAYHRLIELDKEHLVYATPLAQFGIRQARAGRRVGSRLNQRDVMSEACRGVRLQRLDRYDAGEADWKEAVVEDRRAGPAETATARLDLAAWFRALPRRNYKIARALGRGDVTREVAQKFHLTPGRISQLRRWLHAHWSQFYGEAQSDL